MDFYDYKGEQMFKKIIDKLKNTIHEYIRLRNKRMGSYIWVGEGENPLQ